jgi:malonate-semialdehyde dehydrogenase (acetylating) / methylmalonate-semialdehyde dehydrogenase
VADDNLTLRDRPDEVVRLGRGDVPAGRIAQSAEGVVKVINHWIDGKTLSREPERVGDVYDPAVGRITAHVALASPEVVDEAVASARRAFDSWRDVSLARRASLMFRFQEILRKNVDRLAATISNEHGKVLSDARGEIARGLEVVEYACGIPTLMKGDYSENVSTGVDLYSIRQPLGVVAGITPFNFPAMVPMWMYPVAIACGNTFVLKPSEKDPSTGNLMAELLAEAGLPDGVFNVLHGDKVAVDRLLEHPDVAAISSVGSTPVARYIYETAARYGKRVQALGGAKNHMIVLPDADMDLAADSLVGAAYGSTGQRCMAISSVVALGNAADDLIDLTSKRVASLKVGPGTDPDAEMGPLVTGEHRQKVLSYVEAGIQEGAELAIDGRAIRVENHEDGFWLGPTLFDRVETHMSIYRDEIFGPVGVVVRTDDLDRAIAIINNNEFGNGTAIFTRNGSAARKFVREIEVGMVGVNIPIPVPLAFYSFGGWKSSLFGDSHIYGPEGVHFYTRGKVVTSRWPDVAEGGVQLVFPSQAEN